ILNTDDPVMFGCTLTGEYELAAREFGFTAGELGVLAANSFRYAFTTHPAWDFDQILPPAITSASIRNVDEWIIPLPEVREAIGLATAHGIAVVGVESFRIAANGLGVMGSSGYECEFQGDWSRYVDQNNSAALRYIDKNPLGQGYGYTLVTKSEGEFRK